MSVGATAGSDDDQPDGQTARHSIETIEKYTAAKKPWMVAAGFHRPHDPFLSPKKYFELYPTASMAIYHDPPDATPLRPLSVPGGAFADAFNAFTEADRQEFQRAYYAGVSFMDAQVGRLIETMDRLKIWDHTLVIFIGDNGYHHNERNWWNKSTLFERSCRVPCVIAAPGAKHGKVCRSLIEFVDLYPTVADYCGVRALKRWRAKAFAHCSRTQPVPAGKRRSHWSRVEMANLARRFGPGSGVISTGATVTRNCTMKRTIRKKRTTCPTSPRRRR